MGLSEKRAETVATELVTAGIPAEIVVIEAFGETDLAVPTPDNTPGAGEPPRRDRLLEGWSAQPDPGAGGDPAWPGVCATLDLPIPYPASEGRSCIPPAADS